LRTCRAACWDGGYVRSFATSVKLDPEVIVSEFVAQFPESSVTHGYPPAERAAAEKVADIATAGQSTKIHLNGSGNWTRVAPVVVLAIVLAGVMTFAAPRGWDALRSWAKSVPGNSLGDFMSAEARLETLDARPIQAAAVVRTTVAPFPTRSASNNRRG
jgi:hypothetical protein